ncbi:MAG: tRNA 2-thiouridine(34) synthase MnmA, partial [Deltaproteobacteria bacterium]|nr:tRNA 2-thiouridine(34) synthase MnmA [Nannocystaceae bacterium]
LAELPPRFDAHVQLRHRSAPVPAHVTLTEGRARIELDGPFVGVAPGQAAVIYDGPRVLGGGWITA